MVTRNNKVSPSGTQRFYRLVREVTTRLVGAQATEIDAAVDNCLAKLGEHFNVTQVGLGEWTKSGKILPSLRTWGPRPIGDYLNTIGPGPEAFAFFCSEGSLIWNCIEDIEELPQLQEHMRQVGAMAGAFWLYRDSGSHTQHLAMAKANSDVWPGDTVKCLAAIGEVLFNALYRRQAEIEAERLHRLERVISDVAARFVHVSPEGVDAEINKALRLICETTGADLGVFLRRTEQATSTLTVSHEWNADTLDGPYFRGDRLADNYPWLARRLKDKEPVVLSNLNDSPPVAEAEQELFEQIGIQSMVWAPFEATCATHGYIGLSAVNPSRQWPGDIGPQLGLIGNVIANAIERQRTDLSLEQAFNEIQDLKNVLAAENETLRLEVEDLHSDHRLVGKSQVFRNTLFQAKQVATTDSTVLLVGETGTGKGLIARRIHEQSGRSNRPLVTVNCAALPSTLIESELFGHEKGAFTGAINRKIGRFELADGGTIFLDEIGDMPIELQVKMLRVLQDNEFERLGSAITKTVDVRVISATNRDLNKLIEQGVFRDDLYYRLGVFPIRAPALRERRDDIPLLVWFFISELQHRLGRSFDEISERAMDALTSYGWPGNVRELRNVIERAMILSPGTTLELENAFPDIRKSTYASSPTHMQQSENLIDVERAHIVKMLEQCNWKIRGKDGAAEYLGLKRTTLQSRMKKLGIERPTG